LLYYSFSPGQLCTSGTCFTCPEMDKYVIKFLVQKKILLYIVI